MVCSVVFKKSATALLGSFVLAFGIYNIHAISEISEGGQLGLALLLQHWFHISPALSGLVFNIICYLIGWKTFGKSFLFYSAVAAVGFSLCYRVCELFPPVWPQIANYPLAAALLGAVFIGIGCGLCVRVGSASTGDDALAMSLSRICKIKIEYIYLISDFSVLLLSLTYIPVRKIAFSFLTVILSGKIVGFVQRAKLPKKAK